MDTHRGFTVIELMITIVIVAILLTIGVPSMQNLIMDNRVTTAANTFLTELNLARSEAVKRGARVVVCRTNAPNAAPPVCGAGTANTWTEGWVSFVDDNQDGAYDAGEVLVRISEGVEGDLVLMADATAETTLIFNADGSFGNGANATLALCDDRGFESGREIEITLTGRPAVYRHNPPPAPPPNPNLPIRTVDCTP